MTAKPTGRQRPRAELADLTVRELRALGYEHRLHFGAGTRKAVIVDELERAGIGLRPQGEVLPRVEDEPAPAAAVPDGLDAAGTALWERLAEELDLEVWEQVLLETACRQQDDVARLEAAIAADGVTTIGSQGQPRMNAMLTEVRQGRIALAKLLGELRLPDDVDEIGITVRAQRARDAARARWRGTTHGTTSTPA